MNKETIINAMLLGYSNSVSKDTIKILKKELTKKIEESKDQDTTSFINDIQKTNPELKIFNEYHLREYLIKINKNLIGIKNILTFFLIIVILSVLGALFSSF